MIRETFGEDSRDLRGFAGLWQRIRGTFGEYSQGFMRLWERIRKDS